MRLTKPSRHFWIAVALAAFVTVFAFDGAIRIVTDPYEFWNRTVFLSAVAFAALCAWLTIRVVNRKERWAKRTLFTLVMSLTFYAVSFGPACWWFSRRCVHEGKWGEWIAYRVPNLYWPFGWMLSQAPVAVKRPIIWYATLGSSDRTLDVAGKAYIWAEK